MAKEKNGILIYADWINIFEKLTDVEAGKLIKHLFRYVNDLNPDAPDRITELLFEPIKITLKRDLKAWESGKNIKSLSGRMGNLKRWNLDLYDKVVLKKLSIEEAENIANSRKISQPDNKVSQPLDFIAVSDSVSVSVSVKEERKPKKVFTPPTTLEVEEYFKENGYTIQSAIKAFNYYSVANWEDSKGNKIKNWKQKMQGVWFKDENKECTDAKVLVSKIIEELKVNHINWIEGLKPSMYNTTTLGVLARIKDYIKFLNSKGVKDCSINSFKDGFGKWYEKHKIDY